MIDRNLVKRIAGALATDEGLVEKDWHVVRAIAVLAALDHEGATPVFSGGTSLSKGWGLIKRFSEDIDFKVAMPSAATKSEGRRKETSFSLSDASGLSRANKISASAMVKVLQTAVGDFSYGPEYLSSFAVSGVDGTLKEKFNEEGMRRRVRAKTGTLRGVSALAGFGVSREGKILAFSVIVNSEKPKGFIDQAEKITRAILKTRFEKK